MPFKVTVIESEAGWGQKIDSVETFDTIEAADQFREEFNARNTAKDTPSWYMMALEPKWAEE